ncbi:MAG TPA: sulfatase-like hydrolase/transferase, partial [Opitutaceae bacterium]|nr:sulfatase-like hydrolase/transferase [Opitutaceae bacterium]
MPSCTPDFAGGPDLSDTLGITLLLAFFALHLGGTRADAANSGAMRPDAAGMNVLMVIIEDCNAGVWGSYGNAICRTPNMDQFARTAVQFESAYVQATACNPSRSSFLTGLRPLTTRVWANSQVMRDQIPSGTLTLPQMLKDHGLHTAVIGKFFHRHEFGGPLMLAFDRIEHAARPTGWKGPPPILSLPPVPAPDIETAPRDVKSPEYRAWKNRRSSRNGVSGVKLEQEGDYR